MENERGEKENRIRAITKLYYSNPKVQEALLNFAKDRETVPRYFEGFGKRPDSITYASDVLGLVNRGATSLHCSEELWNDALQLSSEITKDEMDKLRKGWDLLIDIDSKYLDLSKIAAKFVVQALEYHGVKNYGIKFSGGKGFHIIVGWKAFPKEYQGIEARKMFPEWPRAITEYLFDWIESEFMKEAGRIMSFGESKYMACLNCGREAKTAIVAKFRCQVCDMRTERKNMKLTKRRLRCLDDKCPGELELIDNQDYYYCEYCKDPDNDKISLDSIRNKEEFEERRGEKVSEHAKFDLVLVAPRHLFRMPYSLHEKTSLASVVLTKEEIDKFLPGDANPLKIDIREYYPNNTENEAERLLSEALNWKKHRVKDDEKKKEYEYKEYKEIDLKGVNENIFPKPIKKLLLGLKDGKKRGLFILLTFYKTLGFPPDYINFNVREWNKKNEQPLKEGYIKSQIDWHLKQRKKILPPNYENEAFYKDLGLLDEKPKTKNPIVDVLRNVGK